MNDKWGREGNVDQEKLRGTTPTNYNINNENNNKNNKDNNNNIDKSEEDWRKTWKTDEQKHTLRRIPSCPLKESVFTFLYVFICICTELS